MHGGGHKQPTLPDMMVAPVLEQREGRRPGLPESIRALLLQVIGPKGLFHMGVEKPH